MQGYIKYPQLYSLTRWWVLKKVPSVYDFQVQLATESLLDPSSFTLSLLSEPFEMGSANTFSEDGQDRAGLLLAVAWTECAISSVFITFRFYCRKRITKNLWWDDWFILITFVSQSVSTVKKSSAP